MDVRADGTHAVCLQLLRTQNTQPPRPLLLHPLPPRDLGEEVILATIRARDAAIVQHPWRPTYLNRGGDAVDAAVAVDTTDNQE